VLSATSGARVQMADVLAAAHERAIAGEKRDDVREALAGVNV